MFNLNREEIDGCKYSSLAQNLQQDRLLCYIPFAQLQDIKGKRVLDFGSGFWPCSQPPGTDNVAVELMRNGPGSSLTNNSSGSGPDEKQC